MVAMAGRLAWGMLGLCCLVAGARADEGADAFMDRPLAASVHLLQGFDCNIVASPGADGTVLVDTCVAESAAPLLAALERLSNAPLRFVVDTHAHADHTGGNAFFRSSHP